MFFKGAAIGAATCFVMLVGASALACTGVGSVFNLGQTNSVDATSSLAGTTNGGAQLQVNNQGGGAGVRADVTTGRAVVGNHNSATGTVAGVEGATNSTDDDAIGVLGRVIRATNGIQSTGVRGINPSGGADRYGVWGSVNGSGSGVFGQAKGGSGVQGSATAGTGVLGRTTTGIALRGLSDSGRGVQGHNLSSTRSINGDQPGVFGSSSGDDGGQFGSNKGTGVCAASGVPCGNSGVEPLGIGLYAASATGNAVAAASSSAAPLSLSGPSSAPPMTVNSTTKVASLNGDLLDGYDSKQFVTRDRVYYRDSGLTAGTKPGGAACTGGATCYVTMGCDNTSDLVLSGGFWGIDPSTTIFANRPLNVNQWQVALTNNSTVDQFLVSVWCADVTP